MNLVKADIYWNLHKNVFSVRVKGKVVAHVEQIKVMFPEYVVSQAGRRRVLAEKRKNVHAFVRGFVQVFDLDPDLNISEDYFPVTYNPYKYDSFVNAITEQPIKNSYDCKCIKDKQTGRPRIYAVEAY